jgi:hypothetical protein
MTLTKSGQYFLTGPVKLHGYQAVMRPSKYGYSLSALLPEADVATLEEDRAETLKWAESKLKNPKRSVLKPEPWFDFDEEPGYVKIKLSWNEETKPTVVDSEGVTIDDEGLPLFSDSVVRLIFKQKPYILRDEVTYGTSLKLSGVQVLSINRTGVGSDTGDLSEDDIANLFTVSDTHGLDAEERRAAKAAEVEEDEDLDF